MPRITLSDTVVLALPEPAQREAYWDTERPELALRVSPSGHKAFYWSKKVNGRSVRMRIGSFPSISVATARKAAEQFSAKVALGGDPWAERHALRVEPTLHQLFSAWIKRASGRKRARSVAEDQRQYDRYLSPWGRRRLSRISRRDVVELHASIGGSAPYQANRVLSLLRSMFRKANLVGWRGESPTDGVEPFPEEARDRFLTPDELPRFFAAVAAEKEPTIQGFFLALLFTGARRSNVESARWSDLDLDRGLWHLEQTKGRPMTVVLSGPAVDLFRKLRPHITGEWVFPSNRGRHIVNPRAAWKRILTRSGILNFRMHDLRRTLGSWQAMTGASLPIIGKSLGHSTLEATQVYARLTLDPVRESVERATDAMLALTAPPKV